jgi:hypothetical protein
MSAMNIHPGVIPALQAKLAELESRQADRSAIQTRIDQAQAASARLAGQMGELGKQAVEHSAAAPNADPERLSLMLAGAPVPPIDTVAEGRLAKFRDFDAQRAQIRRDLGAVTRQLTALQSEAAEADQAVAAAYSDFLDALGAEAVTAYKQAARDFVATFLPLLYSINLRRRQATGVTNAPWFNHIIPQGLMVQWAEPEPIIDGPHHQPRPNMTLLWPRGDLKLLSGEPVESGALIDGLMEQIRSAPAKPAKAAAA